MVVITALVTVFVTLFLYWCYGIYRKNKLLEKIPGPPPIPFFGVKLVTNIYEIFDMFEDLIQKYGKTCKIYIGARLQVLTTDIQLIEDVLKSNVHITKSPAYYIFEPWLKDGLIISCGEKWKQRRKLCTKPFDFSLMNHQFMIIKQSTDTLIRKLGEEVDRGNVINISEFTSKFSLDVVGESSFGVKLNIQDGNRKEYIEAVNYFTEICYERNFSIWKQSLLLFKYFSSKSLNFQNAVNTLQNTAKKIIQDKRADYRKNPDKQLLNGTQDGSKTKSILIDALMKEQLSDEEILEEVNNFLFAGHDTASTSVSFALYELSKHPDIQERLYEEISSCIDNDIEKLTVPNLQDMKYLDMVIKESLRFRMPVPVIERQLDQDALLGDNLFPKGTVITMLLYWLHHDSNYFPDPEKFDPERFNMENQLDRPTYAFLPFSAGPRNCIGQKYAQVELKAVVARIVFEFTIHPVENFKLVLGIAGILRSKDKIPIRLKRRTHTKKLSN